MSGSPVDSNHENKTEDEPKLDKINRDVGESQLLSNSQETDKKLTNSNSDVKNYRDSAMEDKVNKDSKIAEELQLLSKNPEKNDDKFTNYDNEPNKNSDGAIIADKVKENLNTGEESKLLPKNSKEKDEKLIDYDNELKKNLDSAITTNDIKENSNAGEESQLLLKNLQENGKKLTDYDQPKKNSNDEIIIDKMQKSTFDVGEKSKLLSKNIEEKDAKLTDHDKEPKNRIPKCNKGNNKFVTLLKNVPRSFHSIRHDIKQRISTKFKNYKLKRKTKKEAKKLEKKKLKAIPKNIPKPLRENKFSGERQWFRNQYERYIGLPKTIDERNPSFVLGCLKIKANCQYVPEAMQLCCKLKPQRNYSTFLSWNGPPLTNCMCPHRECFCRGDMVLKAKKIPCRVRFEWNSSPYIPSWRCWRSKPNTVPKDFVTKLVTIARIEAEKYEKLYRTGILNQMGPEICLLRCQHYKVPGDKRTMKYLLEEMKTDKTVEESQDFNKMETIEPTEPTEEEESDRICNVVSCTVSLQTDTGPDGQIIFGKISHFVFASIKDSVLSDLEGKKLQISHYKREFYKVPDNQVCVRKIENLLNIKAIKSRVSKLISSILVIKDPGVPVNTRVTQFPSCGEICDDDVTTKYEFNGPETEISSLSKNNNSVLKDMNILHNIEGKSSCPCCKLYKESLRCVNNKEKNNKNEQINNSVKETGLENNLQN